MPATLEQFAPLIQDERFQKLDPVGKAEFREKAFAAVVGTDPEKRSVYESLPADRQATLHDEFIKRFNDSYGDKFSIVTKEKGANPAPDFIPEMPGSPLPAMTLPSREERRPVMDVTSERFLKAVQDGKVDPSKMNKKAVVEGGALVQAYAPDKIGPWRDRAQELARDEFLPSDPNYATSIARAAGTVAGAIGPAIHITDYISRKTGIRKEDEPLFHDSFLALNPENQALLSIGYPEFSKFKLAGSALGIAGLSLRGAAAIEAAGVPLVSKAGIALGATGDAAIAAAYAKEAPGIIANLAGKPDSYALNAVEAGLFSGIVGTIARQVTKAELLTKARDAFKFTGSDGELLDYLHDLYAKMPRTVEGTAKTVEPTAEAAVAKPVAGELPPAATEIVEKAKGLGVEAEVTDLGGGTRAATSATETPKPAEVPSAAPTPVAFTPAQHAKFNELDEEWRELSPVDGSPARVRKSGNKLWVEVSQREGSFERRGIAYLHVAPDGTLTTGKGGDAELQDKAQRALQSGIDSVTPTSSAPETLPDNAPEFSVKLPDDPKAVVKGKWRIVESDSIRSSRDEGYDAKLQPRDRTRAASAQQVSNIARTLDPDQLADSITSDLGAPIVNANGDVLSGNGRTEAIREAYGSEGGAKTYKEWLAANAERFGLTADQVAGMNRPILVRQAQDLAGIDEAEFARRSNPEEKTLRMSDSENAASDAAALLRNEDFLSKFRPSEEGDVMAASNRDFLNEFIDTLGNRGEFVAKDGQGYNVAKLAPRVRNAILAAVVGPANRSLIDSLVEGSDSMKRVVGGLLNAAPRLLKLRGSDYDIGSPLTKALHDFTSLKQSGETVENFLSQASLFGDATRTAESDFLLQKLAETKSTKAVTEFFHRYSELVGKIDTTTPDMFGESNASRLDILKRAAAGEQSAGVQTDLPTGKPPAADGQSQPHAEGSDAGGEATPGKGGVAGNVEAAPEAGVGGDLGEPHKPGHAIPDDPNAPAFVIELPEIVQLAKLLNEGKYPQIVEKIRALKGRALGVFKFTQGEGGAGAIELRADIFELVSKEEKRLLMERAVEYAQNAAAMNSGADAAKIARERYEYLLREATELAMTKNPKLASKVLAHEIGHLVDWLPDKVIHGRGNLFARIAALKNYTKTVLPNSPGAPGELTPADRARLRREAEKLAEAERTKAAPDPADSEVVSPEEILEIWNSSAARDKDPGLYEYVARLSAQQKKELVKSAMRGKIADWFVFRRDEMPKLTKSAAQFYADLLKEEINKRRLFDLEQMKAELRPVIAWWRGTEKMEAYFEPSEEMYAEAFSVLINNPAVLKERAPKFYEAFFNYLGERPEVKAIYDKIQDDIKSGQIHRARVANLRGSWTRGDKLGATADKMARRVPLNERLDDFRMFLDRTFGPVYRRMNSSSVPSDPAKKAIEDFIYRAATHELFIRRLNLEVLGALVDQNLDWVDLAELMFHQHVIHNRANIASSQGFNPKASTDRLAEMEKQLGPDRFAALEEAQRTYRKIYSELVIRRLEQSQALDPKLMGIIRDRSFYATMSAVHDNAAEDSIEAALRGRFGDAVTGRIYKQVGYLGDVKNPATATAQKALSLISMAYREQAKREIVEFLLRDGDALVQEAPMHWTGLGRSPVDVLNDRIGTLTFLHRGKVRAYYVPRAIYDAFERSSPIEGRMISTLHKVVSPIKAIYTELNYGFWPVAYRRDKRSFARKMPGAALRFGPRAVGKYLPRAKAAAKASLTGKPDPIADAALKRQMLISLAEPRGEAAADDAFERMPLQFRTNPKSWRDENLSAGKKLVEVWNWYKRQGQINERAVKIAGMMYLDEHFPQMPEAIKQRLVHEQSGSPNFLQRPRGGPMIDLFALFYNPWKEGLRSEVKAWRERPGELFAKWALYTAPLAIVAWMFENDKFEGVLPDEQRKRLRDMYRSVPEYDKTNYHVIPIMWADEAQKKVLYVRLPLEEGERLQNGILRKTLTQGEGGQGVLSFAGGQLPSSNPVLSTVSAWFTYKVLGENPYDAFRGRHVIRDDVFEAGEGDAAMTRWTLNNLGAGIVVRFSEDSMYDPPKTGAEKILNTPVVSNLLGRWLKISNRGLFDRAEMMTAEIRKDRAESRLIGQEIVRKINAGEAFTDSERELLKRRPEIIDYITTKLSDTVQRQSGPDMQLLINAKSKEEKAKLIEEMAKERN